MTDFLDSDFAKFIYMMPIGGGKDGNIFEPLKIYEAIAYGLFLISMFIWISHLWYRTDYKSTHTWGEEVVKESFASKFALSIVVFFVTFLGTLAKFILPFIMSFGLFVGISYVLFERKKVLRGIVGLALKFLIYIRDTFYTKEEQLAKEHSKNLMDGFNRE